MNIRKNFLTMACVVVAAACTTTANSKTVTGTADVEFAYIHGVQHNGSPAPTMDKACNDKYSGFLKQAVQTKYAVDPKTLIMSAESVVFGVRTKLYQLGLSGSYSFMSDNVPGSLQSHGIMRIIYSMNKQFKDPESDILARLNDSINCVISNKK